MSLPNVTISELLQLLASDPISATLGDPAGGHWAKCRERTLDFQQSAGIPGAAADVEIPGLSLVDMCADARDLPALDLPRRTATGALVQRGDTYEPTPAVTDGSFSLGIALEAAAPLDRTVVTQPQFKRQFEAATRGVLRHVNWENCCVAGGLVEACLHPAPAECDSDASLRAHFNTGRNASSDVDVWIVGLATEEQVWAKVEELVCSVKRALEEDGAADVHDQQRPMSWTITARQYRPVQIILACLQAPKLASYRSIDHLLHCFDLDCVCVAWDGAKVWGTWRMLRALCFGANLADLAMHGRMRTFEERLIKYAMRGYDVVVPGYDPDAAPADLRSMVSLATRIGATLYGMPRLLAEAEVLGQVPASSQEPTAQGSAANAAQGLASAANRHGFAAFMVGNAGYMRCASAGDRPMDYDMAGGGSARSATVVFRRLVFAADDNYMMA